MTLTHANEEHREGLEHGNLTVEHDEHQVEQASGTGELAFQAAAAAAVAAAAHAVAVIQQHPQYQHQRLHEQGLLTQQQTPGQMEVADGPEPDPHHSPKNHQDFHRQELVQQEENHDQHSSQQLLATNTTDIIGSQIGAFIRNLQGLNLPPLFIDAQGQPIRFLLTFSDPSAVQVGHLLQAHGGEIVGPLYVGPLIRLAPPSHAATGPGIYSTDFVLECVRNGRLVEIQPYELPVLPQQQEQQELSEKESIPREPFTAQDDMIIRQELEMNALKKGIVGTRLWEDLQTKYPRHSWQSWRDRAIKHILPSLSPEFRASLIKEEMRSDGANDTGANDSQRIKSENPSRGRNIFFTPHEAAVLLDVMRICPDDHQEAAYDAMAAYFPTHHQDDYKMYFAREGARTLAQERVLAAHSETPEEAEAAMKRKAHTKRGEFTDRDKMLMRSEMRPLLGQVGIKSAPFWRDFASRHPQHSGESWRNHFNKNMFKVMEQSYHIVELAKKIKMSWDQQVAAQMQAQVQVQAQAQAQAQSQVQGQTGDTQESMQMDGVDTVSEQPQHPSEQLPQPQAFFISPQSAMAGDLWQQSLPANLPQIADTTALPPRSAPDMEALRLSTSSADIKPPPNPADLNINLNVNPLLDSPNPPLMNPILALKQSYLHHLHQLSDQYSHVPRQTLFTALHMSSGSLTTLRKFLSQNLSIDAPTDLHAFVWTPEEDRALVEGRITELENMKGRDGVERRKAYLGRWGLLLTQVMGMQAAAVAAAAAAGADQQEPSSVDHGQQEADLNLGEMRPEAIRQAQPVMEEMEVDPREMQRDQMLASTLGTAPTPDDRSSHQLSGEQDSHQHHHTQELPLHPTLSHDSVTEQDELNYRTQPQLGISTT
ncbi:hypothetical protein BC832DRAFT_97622 [Gaertneriomyces semiglobifer]|nr:hypothetical protein BC832DRAFT_97622 [Gaertneriomyces semiglobifer]